LLATILEGLARCPNAGKTGHMSIIGLRIIDYLIFGPL